MNEKITIELDSKWARRVKSPLYWIVCALTGVSFVAAPRYLYQCGQGKFEEDSWWLVPVCFAVIYLVALFYISLAGEVIASIYRQTTAPRAPKLPKIMGAVGRFIRHARGK